MTDHERCHETVSPETREDVLARDGHRCRANGERGPGAGGNATLHVHHIERDPDGMDMHALENLTTLCRQCHSWQHNQPSVADLPVELTEADMSELLPHDREILQVLGASGPSTTGEIRTALTADVSVMTVRERLWKLMGLDSKVESREQQVVDQDSESGEWGLLDQVAQSARGRIPDAPQLVLQRAADERVRRALESGYDRDIVADIFGVTERTTYHQEKRARAYQFPLDVIDDRTGGRPPASVPEDDRGDMTMPEDGSDSATRQQRVTVDGGVSQPDVAADDSGNSDEKEQDEIDKSERRGNQPLDPKGESLSEPVQEVIAALQALNAAL